MLIFTITITYYQLPPSSNALMKPNCGHHANEMQMQNLYSPVMKSPILLLFQTGEIPGLYCNPNLCLITGFGPHSATKTSSTTTTNYYYFYH